jgi:hypothetical protein
MTSRELADEAESFAQTVAHSVSVFTGRNISFEATAVGEKIMVRQARGGERHIPVRQIRAAAQVRC